MDDPDAEEWSGLPTCPNIMGSLVCADRDNAGSYMTMVDFSSYDEAMANSKDPATSEFAEKMQALSDGPPVFHNLDIVRVENRS